VLVVVISIRQTVELDSKLPIIMPEMFCSEATDPKGKLGVFSDYAWAVLRCTCGLYPRPEMEQTDHIRSSCGEFARPYRKTSREAWDTSARAPCGRSAPLSPGSSENTLIRRHPSPISESFKPPSNAFRGGAKEYNTMLLPPSQPRIRYPQSYVR